MSEGAENDTDRTGELVADRYRIERRIGSGGVGIVFEAVHTWTGRQVALKVLQPEYRKDPGVVRRFMQEARAAVELRALSGAAGRHIVDVLDMGVDPGGDVFLALELLVGETLADRVQRLGRLETRDVLYVLLAIADVVGVAHRHGILHRDLKPPNVFLHQEGTVVTPKLLDFGMAKIEAGGALTTQAGTVMGTLFYMAPEQADETLAVGPPADVWSLGAVAYKCLTGLPPFTARNPADLLRAIESNARVPIGERAPQLSAPLAAALDRALAVRPDDRYPDAAAFAAAIRTAVQSNP